MSGACPLPSPPSGLVELAHGAGGGMTRALIEGLFRPAFASDAAHDGAVLPGPGERLAFTTDAFVVSPLEFPGGDIGRLAVLGTVNDLAMCAARPLHLSAAFVLEEGLDLALLGRIVASMAEAAREAGVRIVTGDTKVVERGKGDGVYIATAGVGAVAAGVSVGPAGIRPGDAVVLSGDVGRHGIAIMAQRAGIGFETALESDLADLAPAVQRLLAAGVRPHCLRDLTRGGLATALAELAAAARMTIEMDEAAVPVSDPVRGACELMGFDPLYLANEGRFVACVAEADVGAVLGVLGAGAVRIGTVRAGEAVAVARTLGGARVLDMLSGEAFPRIC
jgi:hydrogenase expression/formation protein HypE